MKSPNQLSRKLSRHAPQLFGVAITVLLATTSCSRKDAVKPAAAAEKPRHVRTTRVVPQPMDRTVHVTGSLAAQERAELRAKVAGRVQNVAVDLGSAVTRGAVLIELDRRDYELRLQQAAAALAQARAALGLQPDGTNDTIAIDRTPPVKEAKAVFEEARKNRDRVRSLSREGITSTAELDAIESQYAVAVARVEAATQEARRLQALLAQRRAEYDIARQELADTVVRAPFDGAIQVRMTSVGEYLAVGTPVVTIVRADPLRLRLEVPERESLHVRVGQTVRVRVEGEARAHSGRIARLSPAINEANRMLVVEADVPNNGALRPGLFVRAEIVTSEAEPQLAVPPHAVITFAGLEKVIAVRDGKAVETRVQTGRRGSNWVEITSGLKLGDTVVLEPGNLRTGQAVVASEPEAAGNKTAGVTGG